MRILILNWRDIKNPASGGAEILTYEMAKYWVKMGHQVTWFSSIFPLCNEHETIDGIEHIRKGFPDPKKGFQSVYFQAFNYYNTYWKGQYDIVIDEIHGLPFFTPLYVKEKKIAFICELGGILWNMFGPIQAFMGRTIEKLYPKFIYKNIFFVTISPSTKEELIKVGIEEKNISVIPMGISVPQNIKIGKKERKPTIIFVARLTKAKGIEDALVALQEIKNTLPDIQLWIIGRGKDEYIQYLKKFAVTLGIDKNSTFCGFITEKEKFQRISRAHILIVPSIKEGWGLTVAEAGVMGTPSITYNVMGLRDVLKDNTLGIVTKENTPHQLAIEVTQLLNDPKIYKEYQKKITWFKRQIGWKHTAVAALKILEDQLR